MFISQESLDISLTSLEISISSYYTDTKATFSALVYIIARQLWTVWVTILIIVLFSTWHFLLCKIHTKWFGLKHKHRTTDFWFIPVHIKPDLLRTWLNVSTKNLTGLIMELTRTKSPDDRIAKKLTQYS